MNNRSLGLTVIANTTCIVLAKFCKQHRIFNTKGQLRRWALWYVFIRCQALCREKVIRCAFDWLVKWKAKRFVRRSDNILKETSTCASVTDRWSYCLEIDRELWVFIAWLRSIFVHRKSIISRYWGTPWSLSHLFFFTSARLAILFHFIRNIYELDMIVDSTLNS